MSRPYLGDLLKDLPQPPEPMAHILELEVT
jgi:hypothetical protein